MYRDGDGGNLQADLRMDQESLLKRIEIEKNKMYGIAFAYLRNEADALEAIQETVCRVWTKRKSLKDERFFTTWMIRILINVCMDERKKRKREAPARLEMLDRAATHRDPEERMGMAEQIAKLPSNLRMVIVLKYYRDMTITEIAEMMEKPDGTIRTWLHKALKQMRADMGEREEAHRNERLAEEGLGRS
ncbi:sigma-70 family RNA polymerase sigma factor [Paenibacillus sp. LHD-117]|uniref:sigma-70 family RNA polymerase sigma factor n=1 Tax=Paenibacillus sp. LHD-117 TaxID=3071412 RepID=UPI0027DFA07A|nr:sigma-70 family RNA polymerase sigma factor [Paenibacillus sp. LHD-117]MDQ6422775.1 sigma-70 family RNA polymerase sigma factor [Paenibacillus sp. LHD-117]